VVSILVIALRPDLARPWATLDGAQALVRSIHPSVVLDPPLTFESISDGLQLKPPGSPLRSRCGYFLSLLSGVFR
jgi:hypothetical protein